MRFRFIFLLILGFSLLSMESRPVLSGNDREINIDSIVKPDSVKYFIFTSSHQDSASSVRRLWLENHHRYLYLLTDTVHNDIGFVPKGKIEAIVKPKSFLQTIECADWNLLAKRMNKTEADELYRFFVRECHEWKRKSGKETALYFIDRKDFSRDSIKIYRVYCQNSRYHITDFLDELDY